MVLFWSMKLGDPDHHIGLPYLPRTSQQASHSTNENTYAFCDTPKADATASTDSWERALTLLDTGM